MYLANAGYQHLNVIFFEGKNTAHIQFSSEAMTTEMMTQGIQVFSFCEGAIDTVLSVLDTFYLFLGGGLGTHGNV